MGVYKRSGSSVWHCEFVLNGERIRMSTGATRKRDAEQFEAQLRQRLYAQRALGEIEDTSVGEAVERFINTVLLPRGNPLAAQRDKYVLGKLVRAFGEDTPLSELSARRITGFRDRLLAEGLKPATANRYLAVLHSVLTVAKREWSALAVVPTVKLLPLNNKRYRYLTNEEEARLLSVCSPHIKDLVIFLLDTGARKSEALGLKWADVDLDRSPRPLVRFMQTKNGKPRAVPLTARAEALLRHYAQQGTERTSHLFRFNGKPLKQPHRAWKTACVKAGLDDVVMHDLRHTFASRLVMRGVPIIHVSKLLGHSDIRMTLRYAHLAPEALDGAIEALDMV